MAIAISLCALLAEAKSKAAKSPDFAAVAAAVEKYFATVAGYQSGDLISQSQIAGALKQVEDAGFKAPNAGQIIKLGLPDNSFLVREFSTPTGRQFIRKTGRYAGGYARLDRLGSISDGQKTIRQLMRDKDGDKFIEYLATTKGGHNLGSMIGGARHGVDLNKPTGRIYTAADLIAVLKKSVIK
jgi:hypothetical protein